jgi:hypothetical protein
MAKEMIIKQARILLLRSLDKVYPSGINAKMLYQIMCTVDPGYGFDLMKKDVAYFLEKGYIRLIGLGACATLADLHEGTMTVLTLTAAGLEVAQHLKDDAALEF